MRNKKESTFASMRLLIGMLLACSVGIAPVSGMADEEKADRSEWTILVYMNAKNDLEPFGIEDFLEMARAPEIPGVNLVVQFGRPQSANVPAKNQQYGAWEGVYRYRIRPALTPTVENAIARVEAPLNDMGSAASVEDFMAWGKREFPARKYAVVIWNHGQGWRLVSDVRTVQGSSDSPATVASEVDGFRSISYDDDTKSFLYNRQLVDALRTQFKTSKLDIVSFDACLMAMVETGFAFREVAEVMVGSQELEPGAGWDYERLLKRIEQNPKAGRDDMAKFIVDAYEERYGDLNATTLSAVALSEITPLAEAVSDLAKVLMKSEDGLSRAKASRETIESYGQGQTAPSYIDLGLFLEGLVVKDSDDEISRSAKRTRELLTKSVQRNYRSKRLTDGYGSNGLSIYFPSDVAAFQSDPAHVGYERSNAIAPVEFVEKYDWTCFLLKTWFGIASGAAVAGCPK